tara:strand:- start:408 stop:707 length:300 start_codon:yes stop_codon:yes gene_type:complete
MIVENYRQFLNVITNQLEHPSLKEHEKIKELYECSDAEDVACCSSKAKFQERGKDNFLNFLNSIDSDSELKSKLKEALGSDCIDFQNSNGYTVKNVSLD